MINIKVHSHSRVEINLTELNRTTRHLFYPQDTPLGKSVTYTHTHIPGSATPEVTSIDSQTRTLGIEGAGLLSNEPVDVQTMFMSSKSLVVPDRGSAECNPVTQTEEQLADSLLKSVKHTLTQSA